MNTILICFVSIIACCNLWAKDSKTRIIPIENESRLTLEEVSLKNSDYRTLNCKAYGISKKEMKFPRTILQSKNKMQYELFCRAHDIGDKLDLKDFGEIAGAGADEGDGYRKESWFIDINNDGYLDLFIRTKTATCPNCENLTATEKRNEVFTDKIIVAIWNRKEKIFDHTTLEEKKLADLKKKYDFTYK